MDNYVSRSERRLSEIGVVELDGVRELLALGAFCDDRKGAVVMQGGANVEAVLATEVQRRACVRFGMDAYALAKGSNGRGIIVEAAIEVLPGRFSGVEGDLAKDIGSELGLR